VKLSSRQRAQLVAFEELLLERALKLGLIARGDLVRLRERHIEDCLRAAAHVLPNDRRAYDLGSGAGLPGVVLAIAVPTCRFVLVESRSKRAGFIELAIERLRLPNAEVFHGRAEDLPSLSSPADLVTARAFAPLETTWRIAHPLLRPGGRLVFFAGREDTLATQPTDPEPPATVAMDRTLANQGPLVIMARG
jgi:16S rRNA (guanine(527)-N(7))-methyltransferase RsmG